jgi:hypothetical protein
MIFHFANVILLSTVKLKHLRHIYNDINVDIIYLKIFDAKNKFIII